MTKQAEHITIKANAHKTRWFVRWYWQMTQEELLKGMGEKYNSQAFNNEEGAKEFARGLSS